MKTASPSFTSGRDWGWEIGIEQHEEICILGVFDHIVNDDMSVSDFESLDIEIEWPFSVIDFLLKLDENPLIMICYHYHWSKYIGFLPWSKKRNSLKRKGFKWTKRMIEYSVVFFPVSTTEVLSNFLDAVWYRPDQDVIWLLVPSNADSAVQSSSIDPPSRKSISGYLSDVPKRWKILCAHCDNHLFFALERREVHNMVMRLENLAKKHRVKLARGRTLEASPFNIRQC